MAHTRQSRPDSGLGGGHLLLAALELCGLVLLGFLELLRPRPRLLPDIESGPLRAVHLSRHKWPEVLGEGNCCPLRERDSIAITNSSHAAVERTGTCKAGNARWSP